MCIKYTRIYIQLLSRKQNGWGYKMKEVKTLFGCTNFGEKREEEREIREERKLTAVWTDRQRHITCPPPTVYF